MPTRAPRTPLRVLSSGAMSFKTIAASSKHSRLEIASRSQLQPQVDRMPREGIHRFNKIARCTNFIQGRFGIIRPAHSSLRRHPSAGRLTFREPPPQAFYHRAWRRRCNASSVRHPSIRRMQPERRRAELVAIDSGAFGTRCSTMVCRLLCLRPVHLSRRPIITARISLVTIQWTPLAPSAITFS